jgi:hypothetical protein
MILADVAEEMFKTADRVIKVEAQIPHEMRARLMACRSAAGENSLGFPGTCFDGMVLEKRNGKKRYIAGAAYIVYIKVKLSQVFFVEWIVL